jgi:hypothetical protein
MFPFGFNGESKIQLGFVRLGRRDFVHFGPSGQPPRRPKSVERLITSFDCSYPPYHFLQPLYSSYFSVGWYLADLGEKNGLEKGKCEIDEVGVKEHETGPCSRPILSSNECLWIFVN